MKYLKHFENNTYTEIEFVCYNTETYSTTSKINQLNLYRDLLKIDGCLPYLQNWDYESNDDNEQRSLAVVMFNENLGRQIIKLADKYDIEVDLYNIVSQWKVREILDKSVEGMYIPEFNNVISYDFDGVLHTSVVPGTIHPISFDKWQSWKPNKTIFDQIRHEAKNHSIVVVSSRNAYHIPAMKKYIEKYDLPIQEIFLSEGDQVSKSYILKSLGAIKHYDDNPDIKKDVESVGTEFVLV